MGQSEVHVEAIIFLNGQFYSGLTLTFALFPTILMFGQYFLLKP